MTKLILLFLAIYLIVLIYVVFQAIGGKLFGAVIQEIGIFIGSAIKKFNILGLTFSINYLPTGGYVKFTDDFEFMSPVRKILIVLFGLASYLVLPLIILGIGNTFDEVTKSYWQMLSAFISPIEKGSYYVQKIAELCSQGNFLKGAAILSTKMFVFNGLPFGLLNGGMIVLFLIELCGFKSEKFSERFNLLGFFLSVIIMLIWGFSISVFIWRSL